MKKSWMSDLTRRRWSKPSTNSCSGWRSKRRGASRTWPPYCHTCPSLHKGPRSLHVCGRGYGGWFSPSAGQRSGPYVHPVGVASVPTRSGSKVTNPGYPGSSQFTWLYPWPVNSTILVLSRLENCSDRMNVAFLLCADKAVYQICTPTVNSHCPNKGTISVAAVQGSAQWAHRFSGHATEFIGHWAV